ncbi:MAG: release factor glutamine methyltransferase, partial [Paracoccaceae bacterium]
MNDTNQRALQSATQKMLAAGIESAANDARHLLAYALDIKTERLMLVLPDVITTIDQGKFDTAIKARLDRQPVSHILGRRSFWGRDLKVTPSVLDPRPETECLIEAA